MKKQLFSICMLSLVIFPLSAQQRTEKTKEIQTVTVTKAKKAIEQRADRTLFDFSEQPALNSGSVMEGVKKLPGLIVSDVAGMLYQGKPLSVFLDGRPLYISSNELNSFLEGMPANSIDRVEIITQPGAEFPATSGGAIMNIISNRSARNYLTATYSGNYRFTHYDKHRNLTNNSLLLNSRNKYFAWQLNVGQNYREGAIWGKFANLNATDTDRQSKGYFGKAATTFDIGNDRLTLNYDMNYLPNSSQTSEFFIPTGLLLSQGDVQNDKLRQEGVVTYQKQFTDKATKLDLRATLTHTNSDFVQTNPLQNSVQILNNKSETHNYNFRIDYAQPLNIFDEGKFATGGMWDQGFLSTFSFGSKNLDYSRTTFSVYTELTAKIGKVNITGGVRGEKYELSGIYRGGNLQGFNQFQIFPNASLQYNFFKGIFLNANYNRKISLPDISLLNPNNTVFQGQFVANIGNPNIQPTISNNYEIKLSAFDYAFIGYSLGVNTNQVMQRTRQNSKGLVLFQTENIPQIQIHNFQVGIPIPYRIFTQGLKETMKFNFNPDKINFSYLYAAYQKHILPDLDTNGFFIINLTNQFILPKSTKLNINYFQITKGGNYYYFKAEKPFNHSLDVTISKKFMNDRLNISIFANDILNTSEVAFSSLTNLDSPLSSSNNTLRAIPFYNKTDTRTFGISLNYKIPTSNRLAKELPNILSKDKPEESSNLIGR